ncbi:hypothetical protein FRC03_001729 [Tulasnella sp. 419]|nr:hypothetical protein FRC03_001729 [Tulasnella sp. 419]
MSRSMVQKFQSLASTKKPELIQPNPAQGQDTPNGNHDQMVTLAQQREHLGLGSGNRVKAAAVPKDTRRIVTSETGDHEVSSDQPVKGNSGSATTSEFRPNQIAAAFSHGRSRSRSLSYGSPSEGDYLLRPVHRLPQSSSRPYAPNGDEGDHWSNLEKRTRLPSSNGEPQRLKWPVTGSEPVQNGRQVTKSTVPQAMGQCSSHETRIATLQESLIASQQRETKLLNELRAEREASLELKRKLDTLRNDPEQAKRAKRLSEKERNRLLKEKEEDDIRRALYDAYRLLGQITALAVQQTQGAQ